MAVITMSDKELARLLMPFAIRHVSPEEKAAVKAKVIDREQVAKD